MKKFMLSVASAVTFAAYFALSLSCASTRTLGDGVEATVYQQNTVNTSEDYDLTLVSAKPSPSRILKVVSNKIAIQYNDTTEDKEDFADNERHVYYAISNPFDTEVKVEHTASSSNSNGRRSLKTSSSVSTFSSLLGKDNANAVSVAELDGKYLLNEADAKQAVAFINQIEKEFKESRSGEGVLNKYEVKRRVHKTDTVWVPTSKTKIGAATTEAGEYKTVEWTEEYRIFFIQHATSDGKDEILYAVNGSELATITLPEALALRDALSK